MDLIIILIIVMALGGVGLGPWWGYHHYGYAPSGLFGLVFIILLVMLLTGRRF